MMTGLEVDFGLDNTTHFLNGEFEVIDFSDWD